MKDVFITENFLLENEAAVRLYHEYARDMPIIDYHCHLPPHEIATDRRFENLTQIWLCGDHYKWRAMRAAGSPVISLPSRWIVPVVGLRKPVSRLKSVVLPAPLGPMMP